MGKYDLDTALLPDVPVTETQEVSGQSEAEKEVPEETGQTSEITEEVKAETKEEASEEKQETKTEEASEKSKKYANLFTTEAGLFKSAKNLSIALNEEIDFKDMTASQAEKWFLENRPRLEKEGFTGDKEKAKKLNKDIKKEEKGDVFSKLEAKLDKVLETKQEPKKEEVAKPQPLLPPIEPELDEDRYAELLIDDSKEAAKMFREYRKAQTKYMNDRIEYEGARLGQALAPVVEGYQKLTKAEQERAAEKQQTEAQKTAVKEWDEAKEYIQEFVDAEQGKGSFSKFKPVMDELLDEDGSYYVAIGNEHGKQKAMFKLYQNAVERSQRSNRESRLAQLEAEIAALKNGETLDTIQAAKEAARISQTNGGVTKKTPQKQATPQEIFEAQMLGNSQTRSKYDLDL
jgi:hypothetical protein